MRNPSFLPAALSLVLAAATLSATAQDAPAIAPGGASVIIYRLKGDYAAMDKPPVTVDAKVQVQRFFKGRYLIVALPAGAHTVASTLAGNQVVLDVKPGETYYVRLGMTSSSLSHRPSGRVILMDTTKAKAEVAKLKPVKPGDTEEEDPATP